MAHPDERPLTPAMHAYLGAFDRLLFAQTHTERVAARHAMREQLQVVLDEVALDAKEKSDRRAA